MKPGQCCLGLRGIRRSWKVASSVWVDSGTQRTENRNMTRANRAWCCNVRPATLDLPRRIFRRVLVLLLALAGIGVAIPASAQGRLCTDNDLITFGNRFLGTYTSANVVVTNCGNQSWSFTDVSVHPATGPAFQ